MTWWYCTCGCAHIAYVFRFDSEIGVYGLKEIGRWDDNKHTISYHTIQVWSVKSGECTGTYKPAMVGSEGITINSIQLLPRTTDQFVVCNRSNTIYIMNIKGQVWHSILWFHMHMNLLKCRLTWINMQFIHILLCWTIQYTTIPYRLSRVYRVVSAPRVILLHAASRHVASGRIALPKINSCTASTSIPALSNRHSA